MSEPGTLEAIWIKSDRGGPMRRVERAVLIAGVGLEGNADRGGYRQVTLLALDGWEAAEADLGVRVDPEARRANLLVRGLGLAHTAGRVLRIGNCRIEIRGETRPCDRMDEAAEGLREALDPDWRAGAYGMVVEGGPVAVGDLVGWA